jgi:hypothetical protein
MTEIITYSLRANKTNSDEYYQTMASFCDEVMVHARDEGTLEAFLIWCDETTGVSPRSRAEGLLEMLNLGVLWREYGTTAMNSRKAWRRLFGWLAALRKRSETLKPAADKVRGWLGGLLTHKERTAFTAPLTLEGLELLLEWLGANGEFSEEVDRLKTWRSFLGSLDSQEANHAFGEILNLADWFKMRSLEELGKYTENVDEFLVKKHPRYRWREDWTFTGRQRVEYHLNMLGSEILNRSLRASFLETKKRIVILPPCMKAKPEDECQAEMSPYGERCASCTPDCHVNQVTRLGEKQGYEVLVMPDELKTFAGDSQDPSQRDSVGLVGISCPLTNTPGGWEMKRLGVPAQGLLLDYCGCIWHWHKDGIPTDINFNQLVRTVTASVAWQSHGEVEIASSVGTSSSQ